MKYIFFAAICLCGVLEGGDHHDHEGVGWTAEKAAYADIQIDIAGPGAIQHFARVAGEITLHPAYLAYVTPRVEGTVAEIRKSLGDRVEEGEILAILESPQIAEAKSSYLAAKSRLAVKEEILKWESSLKGISAGQDYLQAKWAYEEALIECECARQALYARGFCDQDIVQMESENPKERRFFALKAPFQGRILARNLTLGELTDDHTLAFSIGNSERVCVEMHIPQEDIAHLREGQEVTVFSAKGKESIAWVTQLAPSICEKTRMAKALAVMDNLEGKWSPGQYVTGKILTRTLQFPLVVPKEAVQKIKGENAIFVQCGDHFELCRVKVGKMDEERVEIIAGLKEGECYASRNAFCLKADYEKEELEHEH